jgi:hypothetical protein
MNGREFALDDWAIEEQERCVVCPGCAFTFAACHTDGDTGGYSCPVCGAHTPAQIDRSGAAG